MSDATRENISALLDGELDQKATGALLQAVEQDADMRGALGRYQLISDALRGEPVGADAWRLADRVRAQLEKEPIVVAPTLRRERRRSRWMKPAAGVAVAASLAVGGVVMAPRLIVQDPLRVDSVARNDTRVLSGSVAPGGVHWTVSKAEVEKKLNAYLLDHRKRAPATYRRGAVPYATFVGYDAQR